MHILGNKSIVLFIFCQIVKGSVIPTKGQNPFFLRNYTTSSLLTPHSFFHWKLAAITSAF